MRHARLALLGLTVTLVPACKAQSLYGGPPLTPVEDADNDGHPASEDCDESDPAIHPDATETAGDGVDSNCDGEDDPVDDTGQ